MQYLFVDVLGENGWSGPGRNKDIALNVLLQDNDLSVQVPWYESNVSNKSLLENRSSRSSYTKIMVLLFIDRKVGPIGPGRINMGNKDIALNVLLQDNDMRVQVPWYKRNVCNKSLLENRSSRSSFAKIMVTLFINRKVGPVGPCKINVRNVDTTSSVLFWILICVLSFHWINKMF